MDINDLANFISVALPPLLEKEKDERTFIKRERLPIQMIFFIFLTFFDSH